MGKAAEQFEPVQVAVIMLLASLHLHVLPLFFLSTLVPMGLIPRQTRELNFEDQLKTSSR